MTNNINNEVKEFRKPDYIIDPIFVNRWSPRAMSGEELTDEELFSLFEAARWAPSSYNSQPWRFIYAKKNTEYWEIFFNLLKEFNQIWTKNSAVLVVIVSKMTFDHNDKFSMTHSFDTGAAWQSLALEGSRKGLVVHGIGGFDYDKAREVLEIPEGYNVEIMVAIGKKGKEENLPKEMQKREIPSDRKKIEKFVFEGKFFK